MHACKKYAKEALVMVPSSKRYTAVSSKRPVASSDRHEHVGQFHGFWNILQTRDPCVSFCSSSGKAGSERYRTRIMGKAVPPQHHHLRNSSGLADETR